jgi:putative transposase
MPQSYTNLLYHIVYSTKERQPLITNDLQARLYDYIGGMIRKRGGICLAIGGMNDHVHILAKLKPDNALSDVLRDLKANSTGWMHDVFPEMKDFNWQRGYGAFTVSSSPVDKVREYILNQAEHHQKVGSFREEFIKILIANEIEFDEKYLWT